MMQTTLAGDLQAAGGLARDPSGLLGRDGAVEQDRGQ